MSMVISLDTNVWIFGLLSINPSCEQIMLNLSTFRVVVPDQIRAELERNLTPAHMKTFYQLVIEAGVQLDLEVVPEIFITMFEAKGLKKGDAVIGTYAEWRKIDAIVSDNRDFLRGLSGAHSFEVLSPQEFCQRNGLWTQIYGLPRWMAHTSFTPLWGGILCSGCTTRACSGAAASTRLGLVPAARQSV